MRRFHKLLAAVIVPVMLAVVAWCGVAAASESGAGTFRPGLTDLNSGDLPAPGTTMAKTMFLYQDADSSAANST